MDRGAIGEEYYPNNGDSNGKAMEHDIETVVQGLGFRV